MRTAKALMVPLTLCILLVCSMSQAMVLCTSTIGDYVWLDANHNGIQDPGEQGIDGVQVILYDEGQDRTFTTVTATGGPQNQPGYYLFSYLCAGTYVVSVDSATVPTGYLPTTVNAPGSTREGDSDEPNGTTVVLSASNTSDTTIDFGYITPCTGMIGDYVWLDANRNGIQDAQEMGINGVQVTLYDGGQDKTLTAVTATGGPRNEPGYYAFSDLCAGTYLVSVDSATVPAGYLPTVVSAPGSTPQNDSNHHAGTMVALSANDSSDTSIDFGYVAPCTGKIGDYVWLDANHNGIQDSGEQGINGVEVLLVDAGGARTVTTFTGGPANQPGYYLFDGLCAGTYALAVNPDSVPAGYSPTTSHAPGSTPANDSDDSTGTTVVLSAGDSSNTTIDFGYIMLCTGMIGDYVWLDGNRNGIQDSGEQGINGVQVVLYDGGQDRTFTAVTATGGPQNQPGCYVFSDLCAGTYLVSVDSATVPAGYLPTAVSVPGSTPQNDSNDHAGAIVTLSANDSTDMTIDFGYVAPCTGKIGDYVWFDANHNGIQDSGEPGINGVEVLLADASGVRSVSTFTGGPMNQPGYYLFDGLCADSYVVSVNPDSVPSGYSPTASHAPGSTAANDSDDPTGTSVVLPTGASSNLTIDFGFWAPTGQEICTEDPCKHGHTIPLGTLLVSTDSQGNVTVVFEESLNINDNSYGANAVNWFHGHLFKALTGSDKAEFLFKDAAGKKVLDFYLDYISAKAGTPSGYASLGVSGGDGAMLTGQAAWLLNWSTSLAENLNDSGFCVSGNCSSHGVNLLIDSPPTSPSNTYNTAPVFAQWQFPIVYTVTVSRQAFGSAGFGSVTIPLVHNSPSKNGSDAASQVPCESTPPTPNCGVCRGGVTQLTLLYTGNVSRDHVVTVYEGSKRDSAKKLADVIVGPSSLTGNQFTFTGKHAGGTMGGEISLWVDGCLNTKISTGCSQPIGPGLVSGSFRVIDGYSKDGGVLCSLSTQENCRTVSPCKLPYRKW